MIIKWMLYAYVALICIYAFAKHTSLHPPHVLLLGLLYIVSLQLRKPKPLIPWIQLLLIGGFHYATHQNLTLILYVLTMSISIHAEEHKSKAWRLACAYAVGFILISCWALGSKGGMALVLFVISNTLHFTLAYLLTMYNQFTAKQIEILKKESARLSTHDSLTGLYNYEECHRRLEDLVAENKSLALILLDCNDLKSMNTTRGFQAGNFILKQIGDLLKILFSDALILSRYGGDEFAIVLPIAEREKTPANYRLLLDSELPKLTGIQITYGIATYPFEARTKDDLVLLAEHQLFLKKRELWLKREEHMLRSEKLRVVGELASGMAHEIRNPLTTVRGFLQISKANGYNIEGWYAMIMDEIDRMSELTGEFLQFSKPHSTLFSVHPLQECLIRVVSLTESEATRLGHVIRYEAPERPLLVMMDQDKMIQLILNLVKNAYEAIADHGVIQLKLSGDAKRAVLTIEDNGPGIPSDLLEKIFHPFYTTKESGTGLGLSICHKIVQEHEGTIEVESELGIGTRFIVAFPLAQNPEQINQAAYI